MKLEKLTFDINFIATEMEKVTFLFFQTPRSV